ncbi:hypothetical protein ACFQ1S_34810, partial [Kibdelosporangium lantanae]
EVIDGDATARHRHGCVRRNVRGQTQGSTFAAIPGTRNNAAPTRQRMALRVGEPGWAQEVLEQVENLSVARGEQALLRAVLSAHRGKISSARNMLEPVLGRQARVLVVQLRQSR